MIKRSLKGMLLTHMLACLSSVTCSADKAQCDNAAEICGVEVVNKIQTRILMKQMFCSAILSVVAFLPLVGNSQTGAKSVPQSKSTEKKTTKDDEELLIAQRHAFAVSQVISIADEARSYRDIALRPHVLARAINMSVWTVYDNDPNLINTRLDKVAAVTKADVQRVASKYLTITKRTVVVTMPKPKSAAATTTSSRKGDNHWTEQRRRAARQ
jgi:hypothetical protein